jgi:hypothetical protein
MLFFTTSECYSTNSISLFETIFRFIMQNTGKRCVILLWGDHSTMSLMFFGIIKYL